MRTKVMAMGLLAAAGAAQAQWSDNFNRPDGPMGPDWTQTSGTWAIVSNEGKHTGSGVNTILTHNGASLSYESAVITLDVLRPAGVTSNAFVAAMIGLGWTDAIQVKIQAQGAVNEFTNIGIYHMTSATGWGAWAGGLPFGALQANFRAGRMTITFPDPNTLKVEIDTDFNGIPDQTYISANVSSIAANLGTGHGIGGWLAAASFDNWSVSGGGPTGACCRPDGSCVISSGIVCTNAGGIYRGDGSVCATANCPQPPTGACCLPSSCVVASAISCVAQGGTYRGDNTSCATANCPITEYVESGDAGDLPSTAAIASGNGPLLAIRGNLAINDADMFQINICSPGSFEATTVGGSSVDTQLFLFDPNGFGISHDDDDPVTGVLQSRLSSLFTSALPAGNYYLAISAYDMDPQDVNAALIWASTPFNVERAPDGPGAANSIRSWAPSGGGGAYTIALQGSCFVSTGPACYPNCDGSSVPPILNVSDFICFQTKYAAGDPYANCDGSTTPPILNVSDFICFQTKYAAGCS